MIITRKLECARYGRRTQRYWLYRRRQPRRSLYCHQPARQPWGLMDTSPTPEFPELTTSPGGVGDGRLQSCHSTKSHLMWTSFGSFGTPFRTLVSKEVFIPKTPGSSPHLRL